MRQFTYGWYMLLITILSVSLMSIWNVRHMKGSVGSADEHTWVSLEHIKWNGSLASGVGRTRKHSHVPHTSKHQSVNTPLHHKSNLLHGGNATQVYTQTSYACHKSQSATSRYVEEVVSNKEETSHVDFSLVCVQHYTRVQIQIDAVI